MNPEAAAPGTLAGRVPPVDSARLLAELVPPKRFDFVRFETYLPDPREPTQAAAVAALQVFAGRLDQAPGRRGWFRRAALPPEGRAGRYLDGGFGVGKTHLLASLWHLAPAPKWYGTFVEFTHLAGALTFNRSAEMLSGARLICIDEFELDDPGDTVMMASLLGRLAESGVSLAATSNTLPDSLGEGRFAANDFLREIQSLAGNFDVIRIEGPDYRHRNAAPPPAPRTDAELDRAARQEGATLDDFGELLRHLAVLHPSRYGALVEGVTAVNLRDVQRVRDEAVALRLVVLVDRLYDREVPVRGSGISFDEIFPADLLRGGYRKKYLRAISRLTALGREAGPC